MKVKIFAGLATLFFSLSGGKKAIYSVYSIVLQLECFFIETLLEIGGGKKHLSTSVCSVTHVKWVYFLGKGFQSCAVRKQVFLSLFAFSEAGKILRCGLAKILSISKI